MKLIHNITITVFVKSDEDKNNTAEALLSFLPEDLDKEKITIEETVLKSEHGTPITKFYVKLTKDRHTKLIINKMKEALNEEEIKRLVEEENRVDKEGFFYMRLEKDKLEKEQIAQLTDKGNCFHFKIMVACFPKTRDKAIEVVKKIWEK